MRALADRGFEVHRTDIEGDVAVVVTRSGVQVRGLDETLPAAPAATG
jgi:hypothetical protein